MQLTGSSDQCRQAAEQLRRAAGAVTDAASVLTRLRSPDASWSGVAATCWGALAQQQAGSGQGLALRLGVAGAALRQHADGLDELQRRADALRRDAADAGLHLDDAGAIAEVLVPGLPCTTPAEDEAWQRLQRARLAREALLDRVADLRQHETDLHDRLLRALRSAVAPWVVRATAGGPGTWAPTAWDVPSAAVAGATSAADLARVGVAARSVPVLNVVGFGSGYYVDTAVNGMDQREAVVKNGVLTGIGTGVTVVVGGAAAAASAPVWLTVGGGVVLGSGVGWLAGRVWDAVSAAGRLRLPGCPWAPARPRPVLTPRPGEVGRGPRAVLAERVLGPHPAPVAQPVPHPSPGARPQPPRDPQSAAQPSR